MIGDAILFLFVLFIGGPPPPPGMEIIRGNADYIRVHLHSSYTTITGWGFHLN